MLDICTKCDIDNKITYVWFDTGLEYQATKDHLKFLENKYGIEIKPVRAIKPIPISCKEYGQPFLNKRVSDCIQRLQRHNFKWEDETFDVLYGRYPRCKNALEWWCNQCQCDGFNISNNKYLKEFIVSNPPNFKISPKCCKYAKKNVAHKYLKQHEIDLNIVGVRMAEGGLRKTLVHSCFDENKNSYDTYRPLFWFSNSDKENYEQYYNIVHSACYTQYGMARTGCAGCPFGRGFEDELKIIETYEPKLLLAANHIFGDSYAYTRKYREFCKMKDEEKRNK